MQTPLEKGAENAIKQCLEVSDKDSVVIITDIQTNNIGAALEKAAKTVTSHVKKITIDDYLDRPAKEFPQKLIDEITAAKPTVSIYAAQGKTGELPVFRAPLIKLLTKTLNCRHAHMIGITNQLMEIGMNQDFNMVYSASKKVMELASKAQKILVSDNYGTNLVAEFDPKNIHWKTSQPINSPGLWFNLPTGETFTSPINVNGTFAGWVLGEYLSEKYGVLDSPIVVTIKDGFVEKVESANELDEKTNNAIVEFNKYINELENGNRVGEFGIGTLIGLKEFVGNLLQDEKFPGVHIAFGHPYNEETGQTWHCETHIDLIAKEVNITLVTDGVENTIMKAGKYLLDF